MMMSLVRAAAAAVLGTLVLGGQTLPMQQFGLQDPALQMRAYTLTAPANWSVAGTMMPPSSCGTQSLPVYRAISPDGSAGKYFLPANQWSWGGSVAPGRDCLPIHQVVGASQYLQFLMRQMHVKYVRTVPVPDLAEQKANFGAGFYDAAIVVAAYSVNGKPMEEYLNTDITCTQSMIAVVGAVSSCTALTRRSFAPRGKLEALKPTFDAMILQRDPQYFVAWQAMMRAGIENRSRAQTQALLYQGALAGQQRMQAHQAYMSQMAQAQSARTGEFEAHEYQKQNNKENEVDFILDCQRLYNNNELVSVGANCPSRQTAP